MDKHTITYLYRAYLADSLDAHELEMFRKLVFESNPELEALIDGDWNRVNDIQVPLDVKEQVLEFIVSHKHKPIRKSIWPRMTAIAASIAIVLLGVYFFTKSPHHEFGKESQYVTDVSPGKQSATLTLANGKQIHLSDALNGKLAEESGVAISKTEDGQIVYELKRAGGGSGKMNSLSTAKGETYQLRLPDGSMVWLNAASSLTYAADLNGQGKRRVSLKGEAYFEISKDKARPFVVESRGQEVEVLGTHFNINAYQDEGIVRTTLLEGRVRVRQGDAQQILLPGTQASNASGRLSVDQVDTDLIVAWKNNNFIFDSQRIEAIMRMIGRWYNVDVVYVGEPPKDTFWGSVSRFDKVTKVLNALESTGQVHFRLQGKTIYVSR